MTGEFVVATVLGFVIVATVAMHLTFVGPSPLRRWDPIGLIPDYRFFAPHPGIYDYHLLRRYRMRGGRLSAWTETPITTSRRPFNLLWNPLRRERKAFFDMVLELGQLRLDREEGKDREDNLESVPYLLALNLVSSFIPPAQALQVQYLIMIKETGGDDPLPKPFFLSDFHDLDR